MVEAKRTAGNDADAPSAKRANAGSGALEEDLDAEIDAQQDQLAEDDVDAMMLDDDIELHLGEAGRNWTRPEPPPLDPKTQSLGVLGKPGVQSNFGLQHLQICCSLPANGGRLCHRMS